MRLKKGANNDIEREFVGRRRIHTDHVCKASPQPQDSSLRVIPHPGLGRNGTSSAATLLCIREKTTPGLIERDPVLGFLVPARRHVGYMQNSMTLRAKQFGARPVQQ